MRSVSLLSGVILCVLLAAAVAVQAGEAAYQVFKPTESPAQPATAAPAPAAVKRVGNLESAVLGVYPGSSHEKLIREMFPAATIRNYTDTAGQVAALLAGEIEAAILDEPVARTAAADNPRLAVLPDMLAEDEYALALRFYWEDLLKEVNAAIAELREEGVLKEMAARWLEGPAKGRVMPDIPLIDDKPTLIVAVSTALPPMLYADADKEPTGFDIELLRRVAEKIGRKLVLREMPFEKLIPTLRTGDVHMAAACLSVTPERKEMVQFSLPYYAGGVAVLTGKGE